MLTLPVDWQNELEIKRAFVYIARIGACPRFGDRPIGWYQQHACAALDEIEERARRALKIEGPFKIRTLRGAIHVANIGRRAGWFDIGRPGDIYHAADRRIRS